MVVLEVQVHDFFVLDPECHPPVAGDMQAPGALAVAGQNVGLPPAKGAQPLRGLHRVEERQHLAKLGHGVRAQALRGVLLVQAAQTLCAMLRTFM
jgi:hypothetical protein